MDEALDHEALPFLYHSGEMAEAARESFKGHLSSCAECRTALEHLDWAAGLARVAAISPAPALTRRALRRALETRAPAWGWPDWSRSAGMGLGLAFAVGLFLFRASNPATHALSWRSGLSTEISELDVRLDRLDTDLSLEAWSLEFDEGLDELSRSQQGLQSRLAQLEEV